MFFNQRFVWHNLQQFWRMELAMIFLYAALNTETIHMWIQMWYKHKQRNTYKRPKLFSLWLSMYTTSFHPSPKLWSKNEMEKVLHLASHPNTEMWNIDPSSIRKLKLTKYIIQYFLRKLNWRSRTRTRMARIPGWRQKTLETKSVPLSSDPVRDTFICPWIGDKQPEPLGHWCLSSQGRSQFWRMYDVPHPQCCTFPELDCSY